MKIKLPNINVSVICPHCEAPFNVPLKELVAEKAPAMKQRLGSTLRKLAGKLDNSEK